MHHEGASCRTFPPVNGPVARVEVGSFRRDGVEILRGVDWTIEAGQHVAFVGPTGAGKTSLMNLLSRFYEPVSGSVRIDGQDLREVSVISLRKQVAVVPQEAMLFEGTLLENLRLGRPEATDAEVIDAATRIGADDVLARLPNGYRTPVGARGSRLSVGERQLVALVRAFLGDPRIVILDEAVSSVDTATRHAVMSAMRGLLTGRTALLVAHHLDLVQDVDQVVVVEGGRIVERGRPEALIAAGGRFSSLWRIHQSGELSGPPAAGTPRAAKP